MNMCRMMDINKDGLVDLNEFLEAFRLAEQARNDQLCGKRSTVTNLRSLNLITEENAPSTSLKFEESKI